MSDQESGATSTSSEGAATSTGCPVLHRPSATGSLANQHWWPEQLNLRPLGKNSPLIDPMGSGFDYRAEFESLDLAPVKADIVEVMTTSKA
ncbi:MAG: catalase/peroxidase HPI, partial [Acidimicrobiales bacterium]